MTKYIYPIIYYGEHDRNCRIDRVTKGSLITVVSDEDLASFAELLIQQSRAGYHILDYISNSYIFTVYIRNFDEIFQVLCKISRDSSRRFRYKLRRIKDV